MLKVVFMNPQGELLHNQDMPIDQLQALKFVDSIDVEDASYTVSGMDYNVNLSEFYVWLKNKEALYI
jgi:hypothetical protein